MKKSTKKPITRKSVIMDVIRNHPETFDIFIDHGVGCIGCHAAEFETIGQGIGMHGIDVDKFVNLLNEKIALKSGKVTKKPSKKPAKKSTKKAGKKK